MYDASLVYREIVIEFCSVTGDSFLEPLCLARIPGPLDPLTEL